MFSFNASSIVSVFATFSETLSPIFRRFSSILKLSSEFILEFSIVSSFKIASALLSLLTASDFMSVFMLLSVVFVSSVGADSFVLSLESRMLSRSFRVALNSSS